MPKYPRMMKASKKFSLKQTFKQMQTSTKKEPFADVRMNFRERLNWLIPKTRLITVQTLANPRAKSHVMKIWTKMLNLRLGPTTRGKVKMILQTQLFNKALWLKERLTLNILKTQISIV